MSRASPRMLVVVDLDGVVADVRHRLHHLRSQPKDWSSFFAAAPQDPVLTEGRRVVDALAAVHDVVYVSGRPERCRADTQAWLDAVGLPAGPVRLRAVRDHRPARLVKRDVVDELARTRSIAVVVDDDPQVLETLRAAGYDVLPATWMGELPELQAAQEDDGRT